MSQESKTILVPQKGIGQRVICRLGPKTHTLEVGGLKFKDRQEAQTVVTTKAIQDAIQSGKIQVIATNPPARFYKIPVPTTSDSEGEKLDLSRTSDEQE